VATLADIAGVQLVKPRVNGRQLHRVSQAVSDETDSDYFNQHIPFASISNRFNMIRMFYLNYSWH